MTRRSSAFGNDEPPGAGQGRESRNGVATGPAHGFLTSVLGKMLLWSQPLLKAKHHSSRARQTRSEYHLCAQPAQLVSGKRHSDARGNRSPVHKLCSALTCVWCGSHSSGPPQRPQDTGTVRGTTGRKRTPTCPERLMHSAQGQLFYKRSRDKDQAGR